MRGPTQAPYFGIACRGTVDKITDSGTRAGHACYVKDLGIKFANQPIKNNKILK